MKKKIKESMIEGAGYFAGRDYQVGEVVIEFAGPLLSSGEAEKIFRSGCDYMLQVDHDQFIDLRSSDARFVNHSCSPNSAFLNRSAELIALMPIKKGEEILFDYSLNENTHFLMNCLCRQPACRGAIGPLHSLSTEQKNQRRHLITPYLRRTF